MIDPDTPYPPERGELLRQANLSGHAGTGRALHLRPTLLLAVVAGGFAGTLCRYGVDLLFAGVGPWPVATFTVNLVGAFTLGLLLHTLTGLGPDDGRLRWLRLVLGTGFLGAFTTYSSLAMGTLGGLFTAAGPLATGWVLAIGYPVASVLTGLVCCGLGIALAESLLRRRQVRTDENSVPTQGVQR